MKTLSAILLLLALGPVAYPEIADPNALAPNTAPVAPAVQVPEGAPVPQGAPAADASAPLSAGGPPPMEAEPGESDKVTALKQAIREKLWKKLSVRYGRKGKVALLKPVNTSKFAYNELILDTLMQGITKFGEFDLSVHDHKIDALALEDFRRVLIRTEADVVVITSLKPDQMNMFIYDRLTPYYVYAHTEALPDPSAYEINEGVISSYTKLLLRRALFEYIEDQYFELPRGDLTPVLKAEIPKWVASAESLAFVNRELNSRFYGGVSLGAALTKGQNKPSFWNTNLLSLSLGLRAFGGLFLEAAYEAFTYNVFLGTLKYIFTAKNSPFRFAIGVGMARSTNRLTLNIDETFAFPNSSNFVVPSIAVMFPIVDVHFKVESRMYFGLTRGGTIFTLMPGVIAQF